MEGCLVRAGYEGTLGRHQQRFGFVIVTGLNAYKRIPLLGDFRVPYVIGMRMLYA